MTRVLRLDESSPADLAALYEGLEARLREDLTHLPEAAGAEPLFKRFAYMRHVGQGFEIHVDLPSGPIDQAFMEEAETAFRAAYKARYLAEDPESAVEGIDWALAVSIPKAERSVSANDSVPEGTGEAPTIRDAWFPEADGFTHTQVWRREAIGPSTVIQGPAIIEDAEATTVLLPGDEARLGAGGHLIVRINGGTV